MHLNGFTMLLNVWAAGPCYKSFINKKQGSGERKQTVDHYWCLVLSSDSTISVTQFIEFNN